MSFEKVTNLGFAGADHDKLAKILGELQDQRQSIVAGAASNVAIAVPAITIADTIRSVTMYAGGVPSDQTANTSIIDLRAVGTVTLAAHVANDTVTVAGKVFTAVASGGYANNAKPNQYAVGATDALTAAALAVSINSANLGVIATVAGAVVTLTAAAAGVAGNAITLAISAHGSVSGANLTGGSATNGIKVSTVSTGNTLVVVWNKKQ